MRFKTASSPHVPTKHSVSKVMRHVAVGLIPGAAALFWFFGWGVILNVLACVVFAYIFEALSLTVRQRKVLPVLKDNSALVTACLLGLALPPFAPWWIACIGMLFAIVFAKHLYGGLGYNPFNPAMVGYVVLLISFPVHMSALWAAPLTLSSGDVTFMDSLTAFLGGTLPHIDAITAATSLDIVRTGLRQAAVLNDIFHDNVGSFGFIAGNGWEFVNLAFLFGGIWMLKKGIIKWNIPVGVAIGLGGLSFLFYAIDSSLYASPMLHFFSGGTMLGIFFIATDPVSGSTTPKGRIIYGIGIGVLIYVIRRWGGFPDAIAFAVLIMNMAAPTIDYYTQPRVFGHRRD